MCSILEFYKQLRDNWVLSPMAALSGSVPDKRLNAIDKELREVYDHQIALTGAFADINFCYRMHYGSSVTFSYLAGVYGRIAGLLQNFRAAHKKYIKAVPELAQYYTGVDIDFDVYAAMKADFAWALPAFETCRAFDEQKGDVVHWPAVEPQWDDVNERFKAAKAKAVDK